MRKLLYVVSGTNQSTQDLLNEVEGLHIQLQNFWSSCRQLRIDMHARTYLCIIFADSGVYKLHVIGRTFRNH